MKRTRHDLLRGIDGSRFLRAAAKEMDQLGKLNARIAEIDARAHQYQAALHDIYYLERRCDDGAWEAHGLEDIAGQGVLEVRRAVRDNLIPAMTWELIGKLVRGGVFNAFDDAKGFVIDQCRFVLAGRVSE